MSEVEESPRDRREATGSDPIAIVGIGCRYADVRGPAEFWETVRSGRDTVREVPRHRVDLGYDIDHFYDPRPRIPGRISSKKAGFLEHPELFDPTAFGIAPRDALAMEPQQRLMVEVTWDALEDAGVVPESIAGERVAVILGYMAEDYSRERTGVLGEEAVFRGHDVFTVGGMSHAVLSGRISFLLGVTGPSFTLDTACSSSLVATHLACQTLRLGESKMALAGGVNLFLSPEGNIALSRSGMLSMSGACKAFDASADGFVRAEGAGVVVLRPLADALKDGNRIYAVIRGSGVSNDGRDGGHMMAPGRKGQAQAMRDAYAQAGISPSEIHYVETHGTGTMIGDPVEIGALADVMGSGRSPDRPLFVASVKGNLGHAESASGVAGLIKAALAIRNRELPAQLHFESPNPAIPWEEIPIRVQTETTPWPYPGPARAGVNSFGISGTNAHVVLESPPERIGQGRSGHRPRRPILLPISGHDPNALHEMVERHRDSLARRHDGNLEDLAHTLCRRRTHRAHRLSVVACSAEEMRTELDAYLAGRPSASVRSGFASPGGSSKIVMVFPGQGSQWLGMGRVLLENESTFAASIDRLDAAYREYVDWSLRAVFDGSAGVDWASRLDVLQPVLVALEIALAELWESWGIRPDRVVGQSLGEIAAAYVAGCLRLEDAARLACQRGRIVAMASGQGAMAVVSLPRDRVEEAIKSRIGCVEVAGSNSPTTTIVSGDRDAVIAVVADFEARGFFARLLDVDFASHCFHMDPLLESFRECIGGIEPRPVRIPFDSTVDGREKAGDDLDVEYWVGNLRRPVAFDLGLTRSIEGGGRIFIEVSPHPTLPRAIEEIAQTHGHPAIYVSSLQRCQDEQRSLMASLGELFVRGVGIDFDPLRPSGRVVETPLYAYQRKRYWFSERNRSHSFRPDHPLLGARSQSSIDPRLHSWDFALDSDSAGFIQDYRFCGRAGAPAGLYPELALAVAEAMWPGQPVAVRNLEYVRPLVLGKAGRCLIQSILRAEGKRSGELRISSREHEDAPWVLHATCVLRPADSANRLRARTNLDRRGNNKLSPELHFASLERCGVSLGPKCRTLRELDSEAASERSAATLLARVMLPRVVESEWYAYRAHPAILEGSFQLLGALLEPAAAVRVIALSEIAFVRELGSECWCRVTRRGSDSPSDLARGIVDADLEFFDPSGEALGWIGGVRAEVLPERAEQATGGSKGLHRIDWVVANLLPHDAAREVDRWILVSDSGDEAGLLAAELQKEGATCRLCERIEDFEPLVRFMRVDECRPWGLALLAWADPALEGTSETPSHRALRVASWACAIRDHCTEASQVWVATRGLQSVRPEDRGSVEAGRLVAQEIDAIATCAEIQQCRFFDASRTVDHSERVLLASLMGRGSEERQSAARGGDVYVPRLKMVDPSQLGASFTAKGSEVVAGDRNFRAIHTGREGLECLALEEVAEPELAPGSVVVEVSSAALSQLDVLTVLGLARGSAQGPRGTARGFAGVVTAVADSTSDLEVGDEVIGVHGGALARRLVVPSAYLVRMPARLTFHEAASLPFAFLVARYVLQVVARLREGERVLIRSAAGGVGQALIRVAQSLGAEVNATAGSSARRAVVRELGAHVVEDAGGASDTADALFEESRDFDVIVSGDSGPAMHVALARLAPGGRYVDLCPRTGFERPELGALRLGANQSVSAIDIVEMVRTEPTLVSALLEQIPEDASRGRPSTIPVTVFPLSEAARALRFMAQNRHVGVVCVDLAEARRARIRPIERPCIALASRGTFVVSGSEAEIQAEIADWLRGQGAEHVVVSRSDQAERDVAAHEQRRGRLGGWIHVASEALRCPDEIRQLLNANPAVFRALVSVREPAGGRPARDRCWETQLWVDRLLLSNGGGMGRCVSVSVGCDVAPAGVTRVLELVLLDGASEAQVVVLSEADLSRRLADAPSPLLDHLQEGRESRRRSNLVRGEILSLAPSERRTAMQEFVIDELAGVLGLSEEQRAVLDVGSRLDALGLDSLMTMELFTGMGRDLQLAIAVNWFDSGPTLADIAAVLVERLEQGASNGMGS